MAAYDGSQIVILEGLEAVRKRPGMYIGSTGKQGLHHLIWEILDNSIDEHLAGYCNKIQITLQKDGGITIQDNGRGVPVDLHPTKKIPTVRVVYTILHAGGKFDSTAYKVSGGLHGVGSSVVNALSSKMIVEVKRDGKVYQDRYENGMLPDTTTTVYLRNFYVGGTPQTAANIGIDWAAPKNWYFNVNATWAGDAYVNLSPVRHEAMPNLWEKYPSYETLEGKMNELAVQDKLKDAFVLNASIGKVFYLNRKVSLNANININNILNNRNIQTYGYQQSRMDVTNYDVTKYPNKISYSQGIKIFANLGIRF